MKRTITVKGIGSVSAKPDLITLPMSLTARDPDYGKAMECAAEKIHLLEQAAAQTGFAKEELKTLRFDTNAEYENIQDPQGHYRQQFTGYACSYQLKLSFALDTKRLAAVLEAIAASGADPELDISFTVKDPGKVSEALLTSAAANAREKAEVLCRASGVALGQLLTINYNWAELELYSPTRYGMDRAAMPMMAAKSISTLELAPEDIKLQDTASFVWEIG